MKVAIVGSRDFPNAARRVRDYIGGWEQDFNPTIVSGGAHGVDSAAKGAAEWYSLPYEEYPAAWESHGKVAGFMRNQQIVDASDKVVAFWDGESPGTYDTIKRALKARKNLEVIFP